MRRLVLVLLAVCLAVTASAAPAAAVSERTAGRMLGDVWEVLYETPLSANQAVLGGCLELDRRVVAPLLPGDADEITCTVRPGTRVFVVLFSSACSTLEPPPYYGKDEPELRACAHEAERGTQVATATVDGRPVRTMYVETPLLHLTVPNDNLFDVPAGEGLAVGAGTVAVVRALRPGTHEIVVRVVHTALTGDVIEFTGVLTIVVERPGRAGR